MSKNQSSLLFDWCVMHLFRYVPISFVRYSPSILRPTLQRSRQRFDIGQHVCRLFAASLRHLCCMFWVHSGRSHLCRIFVASLVASVASACFATSRVPSFTASVAPDPGWLATPGFTELHKAPHFPKCPSSKTSICEHFIQSKNTIFQKCPNYKNKVCPKMPFLQNAGLHKCPT